MIHNIFFMFLLGALSWVFLTFMDRVDEHGLIDWRLRTPIAYIFGILTALSFVFSIQYSPFLYPFFFGLCIEWIVKNKVEYPSHVFSIFLITLYFGYRFDLFLNYSVYIFIYLLISFGISVFLKSRIDKKSKFYRIFYKSYLSKFTINTSFALILKEPLLIIFWLSFSYSCCLWRSISLGENHSRKTFYNAYIFLTL